MLMLIYLLVITPFCKAADVPDNKGKEEIENWESWNQAVADIPDWQQAEELLLSERDILTIPENLDLPDIEMLDLRKNSIVAIPDNLKLPKLKYLYLSKNHIESFDARILEKLPNLRILDLSKNSLTQENVDQLKNKANEIGRPGLMIIADKIGEQHSYSGSIKPAKKER